MVFYKLVKQGSLKGESVFEVLFQASDIEEVKAFARDSGIKVSEYKKPFKKVAFYIRAFNSVSLKDIPSINICTWGGGTSIHKF